MSKISKKTFQFIKWADYRIISKIIVGDEIYKPFIDVLTCQENKVCAFKDDLKTKMGEKISNIKMCTMSFRSIYLVKSINLERQLRITGKPLSAIQTICKRWMLGTKLIFSIRKDWSLIFLNEKLKSMKQTLYFPDYAVCEFRLDFGENYFEHT